jgi:hypothetical protein
LADVPQCRLIQPLTSSHQIKVKSACPSDRHKFDLSDCQPRQVNSIVPISSDAAAAKISGQIDHHQQRRRLPAFLSCQQLPACPAACPVANGRHLHDTTT